MKWEIKKIGDFWHVVMTDGAFKAAMVSHGFFDKDTAVKYFREIYKAAEQFEEELSEPTCIRDE